MAPGGRNYRRDHAHIVYQGRTRGVLVGASASAGPKVVKLRGGTMPMLSTGAAQGWVGEGASALAGPGFGLDNDKQKSFNKTGSPLLKK